MEPTPEEERIILGLLNSLRYWREKKCSSVHLGQQLLIHGHGGVPLTIGDGIDKLIPWLDKQEELGYDR